MSDVVVIGCGVIGAAIAYELSRVPGLRVTVLDQSVPAQGSTGAALGVLMGAISRKVKGRAWQLRQRSIQRYETLIPELEEQTGLKIPYNRQGIVELCFSGEDLGPWQELSHIRQSQGWALDIWDRAELKSRCPHIKLDSIMGAVYSPQDRQVDPTALTQGLVKAAQLNGVEFHFGVRVNGLESRDLQGLESRYCHQIYTDTETLQLDWLVIAAGLGSSPLAHLLSSPGGNDSSVIIQPVLGQALELQLDCAIGNPDFQPVITGDDVHIVPLGTGKYWVGATVEFPNHWSAIIPKPELLEKVRQQAIAFCPELAPAQVIRTWSGKRPRPDGQPAPVIGNFPGYNNVLLATGHYRNGILLAPVTAQEICRVITSVSVNDGVP